MKFAVLLAFLARRLSFAAVALVAVAAIDHAMFDLPHGLERVERRRIEADQEVLALHGEAERLAVFQHRHGFHGAWNAAAAEAEPEPVRPRRSLRVRPS